MNVILWARVSSREQREGYSIDAQLRVMEEKVERMGWHAVKTFTVAESARRSRTARPSTIWLCGSVRTPPGTRSKRY